jgi:hypothetical protein
MMSNPLVLASMTPEQRQAAVAQMGQMPGMGGTRSGDNATSGDGFLSRVAKHAMGALGIGDENNGQEVPRRTEESPQEPSTSAQPAQTESTDMNTMPAGLNEQQRKDWVAGAPGSAINPGIPAPTSPPPAMQTASPAPTQNKEPSMFDLAMTKYFPNSPLAQHLHAQQAGMDEKAKLDVDTFNDMQKQARHTQETLPTQDQYLTEFDTAYQAAKIKGPSANMPVGKYIQKFDPDAVSAITASNNIAIQRANQLFGTKDSDYRQRLVSASKINIDMPDKTERNAVDLQRAMNFRAGEQLGFNIEMVKHGINDPNAIQDAWYKYQMDNKLIDKNGKVLPFKHDSYKDWMKESDLGTKAVNEDKLSGQAAPEGSVWAIRPDGVKVPVHESNVARAKELKWRIID